MNSINQALFDYISASATPFHAVAAAAVKLDAAGYTRLAESAAWTLEAGGKYYVTRNSSSLIAFRVPTLSFTGFQMTAAHSDSPCPRIKENAELDGAGCVRLSTEIYGGMLRATWADRPLSVAGRVIVQTESGIETRLVDLREPVAVIPNVPIHLNREANDAMKWNPAVDVLPLLGTDALRGTFRSRVAEAAGCTEEALLSYDLMLCNPAAGIEFGDPISAPRLDDLQCAFSALTAFLAASETSAVPVFCLFDNEEVGSLTKQGASSTLLPDVLTRINEACGRTPAQLRQAAAQSFLVSCDNAHAVHPNHPEYADMTNTPRMNGGVVIKFNANQRYTTDGVSCALFTAVCREAKAPVQVYANRSDLPGGSTLGSIATTKVSVPSVDIGLAQLAMHSCVETAGAADLDALVRAMTVYYGKTLRRAGETLTF